MPAPAPPVSDQSGPYWVHNCYKCHGEDGSGRGTWNEGIPRGDARSFIAGNFIVATCDANMKDVIKEGGARFGLSPLMPPHDGISDADLDCIISAIREFNAE